MPDYEVVYESPNSEHMIIRDRKKFSNSYLAVPKNFFELESYEQHPHIQGGMDLAKARNYFKKNSALTPEEEVRVDATIHHAPGQPYRVIYRGKELKDHNSEEAARAHIEELVRKANKRAESKK